MSIVFHDVIFHVRKYLL